MKAISIHNPLSKPFTHTWDGKPVTIPAKSTILLEDWLANHIAYHLADQILNDKKLPTDHFTRADIMKELLPGGKTVEASDAIAFSQTILNSQGSQSGSVGEEEKETDEVRDPEPAYKEPINKEPANKEPKRRGRPKKATVSDASEPVPAFEGVA